jgi:hypothetical protein
MKHKWIFGVAVGLVLALCGPVVAGPGGIPGDPDIYELNQVRGPMETKPQDPVKPPTVFEIQVFGQIVVRQERVERPCATTKLPQILKTGDILR